LRPPLDYEIRNLTISLADDLAFARGSIHTRGSLQDGRNVERWLRSTMCFRKIDGCWLIVHDHVSAPLDLPNGRALLNLEP
jgi:ketosteroid isomerase-like protein